MSAMHFDCAKRDGNHLQWYSMGEYYDEIKKVLNKAKIPEDTRFYKEAGEFFDYITRIQRIPKRSEEVEKFCTRRMEEGRA